MLPFTFDKGVLGGAQPNRPVAADRSRPLRRALVSPHDCVRAR